MRWAIATDPLQARASVHLPLLTEPPSTCHCSRRELAVRDTKWG